ncbi:MAG: SDR family NAD(P)-dependent oxidoreductase, partial [Desulfobacteraceae bacterium]|nr:SDR family NAD(P)-dependent oxidoreductase [Desulfobacteraceae bacterium]
MNFDLKDKTALVTGGSRGIGLEIARSLLDEGAKVILCARKKEGLDAA